MTNYDDDINTAAQQLRRALLKREDAAGVDLLRQALSYERVKSYRRIERQLLLIERSISEGDLKARYIEADEAAEMLEAEELKERQNHESR